ncbi:Eugenol synthase 1 [Glycine soja]
MKKESPIPNVLSMPNIAQLTSGERPRIAKCGVNITYEIVNKIGGEAMESSTACLLQVILKAVRPLSDPYRSASGYYDIGVAIIIHRWKINLVLKVEEGLQTMAPRRLSKGGSLHEKKVMQRVGGLCLEATTEIESKGWMSEDRLGMKASTICKSMVPNKLNRRSWAMESSAACPLHVILEMVRPLSDPYGSVSRGMLTMNLQEIEESTKENMERKNRILVFGGTGYIGKYLVRASVSLGHPTLVYTRPLNAQTPPSKAQVCKEFNSIGVTLVHGELEHEQILAVIKQVDIVICALASPQVMEQLKIIDAIKVAGNIKRFLPSDFGVEEDRVNPFPPFQAVLDKKRKIRREIEAAKIPCTFVSANCFALPPLHNIPVSILHSVFVKGDLVNFELGENDLEASQLYPDYNYTSIDQLLDIFLELTKCFSTVIVQSSSSNGICIRHS